MIDYTLRRVALPTGVRLMIYQAGNGPDVLLLHGLTGSAMGWSVLIAQLVDAGYRVTAVDGRGHGVSDRASDYSLAAIAADAAAMIVALALAKPTVIGHSMGGAQSLRLAADHPTLVGRVIVEDPAIWSQADDNVTAAQVREPWAKQLWRWLPMTHEELVALKRLESPHWSDEAYSRWATSKHQVDVETLAYDDARKTAVWEWLKPVDVPMCVIYPDGTRGGVVSASFAAALAAHMPRLQTAMMPGVGHEMHDDDPQGFWALVHAQLAQ